jgi:hypothetical protein
MQGCSLRIQPATENPLPLEVRMAKQPDKTAQAIGAGIASFLGVILGGLPGALIGAAIGHWASGEASKHGF